MAEKDEKKRCFANSALIGYHPCESESVIIIAAYKANHVKRRENSEGILDMRHRNGDQRDRERFVFRGMAARSRHSRSLCVVRSVSSIAIPLVVLIFTGFRSRGGMVAMALTMSLVQLFDAVIGVLSHDASKTYGPLFLALIGFVSVAFLLRSSERSETQNRL